MSDPRLGMNRHRIVTKSAQTRAPARAIVNREGGGTIHPTLGGGCGDLGRSGAAPGGMGQ
jgi:hypothetical protein